MDEPQAVAMAHESIHGEYRQALADAQWNLAKANAQCKVKDAVIAAKDERIAELEEQLATAPQS